MAIQYCIRISKKLCARAYYDVESPLLDILKKDIHSTDDVTDSITNYMKYIGILQFPLYSGIFKNS